MGNKFPMHLSLISAICYHGSLGALFPFFPCNNLSLLPLDFLRWRLPCLPLWDFPLFPHLCQPCPQWAMNPMMYLIGLSSTRVYPHSSTAVCSAPVAATVALIPTNANQGPGFSPFFTYGLIQEMARASKKCWLNTSTTTIILPLINVLHLRLYSMYAKLQLLLGCDVKSASKESGSASG